MPKPSASRLENPFDDAHASHGPSEPNGLGVQVGDGSGYRAPAGSGQNGTRNAHDDDIGDDDDDDDSPHQPKQYRF